MKRGLGLRLVQAGVHVGSLLPLAILAWDAAHDNLTVNPIQRITLWTGKWALVLLALSLVCTPASSLLGFRPAIRWRKPLGVYAFVYASLHLATFVGLDYGFDVGLLKEAIFEKRYALVGFAAFILLVPLAVTSTTGWMRRLGKRWTRLHRLAYPAAVLAVLHYTWSVKADIHVPLEFGAVIAGLLALRWPPLRRAVRRIMRHRPDRPGRSLPRSALESRPGAATSHKSAPLD